MITANESDKQIVSIQTEARSCVMKKIRGVMICIAVSLCGLMAAMTAMTSMAEAEETAGSSVPGEGPVSTTADAYGYTDIDFNPDTASGEAIVVSSGEQAADGVQILVWDGSAVQNSDQSRLIVRNSYIRGETAQQTAPLEGNPGNLLIAGNIRTTLGLGNSQSFYLNSTIVSRNWAALSTDAAVPALEADEKELSVYAYGSEAITQDGGYGAYSDLFCNVYIYGSHVQSAEIGIISGTYGKVTVGTAADAEADPELAAVLTEDDRARRQFRQQGSVVDGGRNALMIHSVNLPPYWEYEGYSQEEIPLLSAEIEVRGSTLDTNLALDKGVVYEPQKAAYIDHTRGSVILIKSTNVYMTLEGCQILPDAAGTGYLIQTVYNNDTMFMNAVPDGMEYPGIRVSMKNMEASGDIVHEDYQRDFLLMLENTTLTGAVNEYDCDHWNQCAAEEGFTDYAVDQSYTTHHGAAVQVADNAVWNVTKDSHISTLAVSGSGKVNGLIYVNGELQEQIPDTSYEGDVLVTPVDQGTAADQTEATPAQEQIPAPPDPPIPPEPPTTQEEPVVGPQWNEGEGPDIFPGFEPDPEAGRGPDEEPETTTDAHEHNWVRRDGGYPADCVNDGLITYECSICGAEYDEIIPALAPEAGHAFEAVDYVPSTCVQDGYCLYECSRCFASYTDFFPASGHTWEYSYHVDAQCGRYGYDVYTCTTCGQDGTFDHELYPPTGEHNFSIVYPTPEDPSISHTWECEHCGYTYTEPHNGDYECICGWSGGVG